MNLFDRVSSFIFSSFSNSKPNNLPILVGVFCCQYNMIKKGHMPLFYLLIPLYISFSYLEPTIKQLHDIIPPNNKLMLIISNKNSFILPP